MKRILLVLSGGGMRGLAHIGVLKALREHNIPIWGYAGTSIGSLVSAFAASGMSPQEIADLADRITIKDILDTDYLGLIFKRGRVPGVIKGLKFQKFLHNNLPIHDFKKLKYPLFVNTVDIQTGANIFFGLEGLDNVPVPKAVYASCCIPGVFRPAEINGRYYFDGAVIDNLPIRLAKFIKVDLVIAVKLETYQELKPDEIKTKSFLSVIDQSHSLSWRFITHSNMTFADEIPHLVIQPLVSEYETFDFDRTSELIKEGVRATEAALAHADIFKRNLFSFFSFSRKPKNPLVIDEEKCINCGNCLINSVEGYFELKGNKVRVVHNKHCPSLLIAVESCPFGAIVIDDEILTEIYGEDYQPTPDLLPYIVSSAEKLEIIDDESIPDEVAKNPIDEDFTKNVPTIIEKIKNALGSVFKSADNVDEIGTEENIEKNSEANNVDNSENSS